NVSLETPVKALLMRRFVIEEAAVKDISWGMPRKKSGALKEARLPVKADKKPSAKAAPGKAVSEKKQKKLLSSADIKSVGDDYFEKQKDMFKTPKLAEEARLKSDELKNKWEPKLKETDVRMKKAQTASEKIKKIDTSKLKKIPEITGALKNLRDNSKEIKASVKYAKNIKKEFDADRKIVSKLKKDIKKAKESDWKLVSAQLNVPAGSQFQSFTQDILSGILYKKTGSFAKHIEKVMDVMAKMKEQEKKKAPPKPKKQKFKGRDVVFNSMLFPKFHLKHAGIEVQKEALSLDGELVNFRTSPEKSKDPATFKLAGSEAAGRVKISGIIDNRIPGSEKTKLFFRGSDFPLDDVGEAVPYVKIKSFSGIYNIDLDYVSVAGREPGIKLVIRIRDMQVAGDEKDMVTEIVLDAVRTTPELVIEGNMTVGGAGKFSSNLDNVLSKKVKERISSKMAASQKKARAGFDAYMGQYEEDAAAKLDGFKEPYEAKINSRLGKAKSYEKFSDSYEKRLEDKKKKAQKKQSDKSKDKVKELFKKWR
ncbi:MAG: hypothetical protein U9O97_01860, partial [Elusimicrobiota bacterium]|nr:hypothetical protein [Elusimicrobiota bacterium]